MDSMEKMLSQNIENPIVYGIIAVFIGMYGPRLAPKLPDSIMNLFKNEYFRFAIMLLVVYVSSRDLQLSLLIGLGFLVVVSIGNYALLEESFENMVRERFENMGEQEEVVATTESEQVEATAAAEGQEIITPVESTSRIAEAEREAEKEAEEVEGFSGSDDTYSKLQEMEQRILRTIKEKYSNY